MLVAYKSHSQFIFILTAMYVIGVWGGPIIYPVFPVVFLLFGLKERYFELLITTLWLLMLSDYVPIRNATYDDLKFAKDLKFLLPLFLFGFFILNRQDFKPYPKLILYFIPFLIIAIIGLNNSINLQVGIQKTISFILMYLCIPMYVVYLHRRYEESFWKALITFIIGMLTIGIVLRFVAPDIALIEGTTRFKGVLGNPNGLGIFLNLTFMLYILLREFKLVSFTKKEHWYIISIILISLFWSGSRNGMMSMFLFYLIVRLVKINWFLAIVIVIAVLSFQEQIFDLFVLIIEFFNLSSYFRVESIEEGSGRKVAWYFALTLVQKDFFIGGGFGHDEHIMRPNYHMLSLLGHQGGVHNSYLSLWFDSGIIGALLYLGGFLTIIINTLKYNYLILAFGISILFNITYESWLVASLNPFTIMFLILLTIFNSNLTGNDYVLNSEEPREE